MPDYDELRRITRLQAERDALLKALQGIFRDYPGDHEDFHCMWCFAEETTNRVDVDHDHRPGCPWLFAKNLLEAIDA